MRMHVYASYCCVEPRLLCALLVTSFPGGPKTAVYSAVVFGACGYAGQRSYNSFAAWRERQLQDIIRRRQAAVVNDDLKTSTAASRELVLPPTSSSSSSSTLSSAASVPAETSSATTQLSPAGDSHYSRRNSPSPPPRSASAPSRAAADADTSTFLDLMPSWFPVKRLDEAREERELRERIARIDFLLTRRADSNDAPSAASPSTPNE